MWCWDDCTCLVSAYQALSPLKREGQQGAALWVLPRTDANRGYNHTRAKCSSTRARFCNLSSRTPKTIYGGTWIQTVHWFGSDSPPLESCAVTASKCFPGLNGRSGVVTVIPLTNPLASAGGGNDINFARFVIPAEISYRLNCCTHAFAIVGEHTGVCVKS
jgi:hypothetical protein